MFNVRRLLAYLASAANAFFSRLRAWQITTYVMEGTVPVFLTVDIDLLARSGSVSLTPAAVPIHLHGFYQTCFIYLPSTYHMQVHPSLPTYSPSSPAPSYSCEPACGEQTLQHTPSNARPTPAFVFIKTAGKTTVVLNDQEESAEIPSYGRQGLVNGTICFQNPENISEVVIKVEGKLETIISEAGGKSVKLLNTQYKLWTSRESQSSTCPAQVPFAVIIPTCFEDGDTTRPLPPSFHVMYRGVPSLFVKTSYNIHIIVTRIPHSKVEFWTKKKHISIPFKYYPRTRAYRPILSIPSFFSTIKTSPEEWYQASSCMKTRERSGIQPLEVHLFVPAGRIYALTDVIPFHLQLFGNVSSLRELFTSSLGRVTSADSNRTFLSGKPPECKPVLRVFLLRQVTVEVKGQKSWRNTTIGEGRVWPMPPLLSNCCPSGSSGHLDWEGELRVNQDVDVGGFNVANVQVKDFISLSLAPPCPQSSPLLELQLTVPIRLVTDSWGDTTAMDGGFTGPVV